MLVAGFATVPKEKRKILFINPSTTSASLKIGISGGEVRLAEIMRGFIKEKWEIFLLTSGGGEVFCKHFDLDGVTNYRYNVKLDFSRLGYVLFPIKLLFRLPWQLRHFSGYVYSCNELLYDVIPAVQLKLRNKNIWAAVAHWTPPLKFWKRKQSTFFASLFFLISEYSSVFLIKCFANIVLAVSEPTAKQLIRAGIPKEKVKAVKCGVNLSEIERIKNCTRPITFDAVFLKRIQSVKGAFDLVDIWTIVTAKKPSARLAIVGGGIDNERLVNYIRQQRQENNITFFGPIFDVQKKFDIICQSKMFVLPSYEENWAIVMGEAMACGLPVLAYDLPELVDVWQDSFLHIPLGDKQLFAQKIIEYMDNDLVRKRQADKGYRYVQQFDWSHIAAQEVRYIEEL